MKRDRKRILLVDDDRDLLLALGIRMREAGFDVVCATSGEEAISVFRTERPDLVLLDLGLPDLSGYAVLDRLQRIPSSAGVPVIVVTARDAEHHAERTRAAGTTDFFQKPVDHQVLFSTIRRVLQGEAAA